MVPFQEGEETSIAVFDPHTALIATMEPVRAFASTVDEVKSLSRMGALEQVVFHCALIPWLSTLTW